MECYHRLIMPTLNNPERVAGSDEDPRSSTILEPSSTQGEDDEGLILWMLSLTPTQRLAVAQGFVDSVRILRNGRRA
jgi:hypothetical protein